MRLPSRRGSDRQKQDGDREQSDVEERLFPRGEFARGKMRVDVTAEQKRLEKEQTRCPHSGTAAEPRKNEFSHERLDCEKQKRAKENRKSERQHA